MGSIWAYYELGWGGFWFWDPVENVSLMPWLALTTLLHCILVLEKRSTLSSWTIILSIATFTLSMCGTFLVRSGILNSVHTFANDPERGLFILTFLFILIFIALLIFFIFHKSDNQSTGSFFLLSKETSILINNWFMMYFLSVGFNWNFISNIFRCCLFPKNFCWSTILSQTYNSFSNSIFNFYGHRSTTEVD